jgi:UDP-2,4-diacetamido-2,4,6-trideoxy-beta-L-altropyranose hydrolase
VPDTLLIRADAGVRMGTGHIMRCLALAQAWQEEGGEVLFCTAESLPALESRLLNEKMQVVDLADAVAGSLEDARQTALLGQQHKARWLVVDGYHFGAAYQKYLKDAGYNLLFLAGFVHADHYYADIVLNPNIYARNEMYVYREPYTQLLLGPAYTLLRREFWHWRGHQRDIPQNAQNILVTLGGSDPDNVTLKVVRGLQQIEDDNLHITIVAGGGNPHYQELAAAASSIRSSVQLKRDVSDMPELMAWADVAISAAGGTCWELAFMGAPSLLLVLAENQEKVAEHFDEKSAAIYLGSGEKLSSQAIKEGVVSLINNPQLRQDLSSAGSQMIDGYGILRVVSAMNRVGKDDET